MKRSVESIQVWWGTLFEVGAADENAEADELMLLTHVRQGYTYLGIDHLERDRGQQRSRKFFTSSLAVPQMMKLFNTTTVPAATYVLGNLYPREKWSATMFKSRNMDKDLRGVLGEEAVGIRVPSSTRADMYIPETMGGRGLNQSKRQWNSTTLMRQRIT